MHITVLWSLIVNDIMYARFMSTLILLSSGPMSWSIAHACNTKQCCEQPKLCLHVLFPIMLVLEQLPIIPKIMLNN